MEMDVSRMEVDSRTLITVCVRDVSARTAHTDALEYRALHDDLTQLPNRVLFADRLDREVALADRAAESRAVLVVDLNRFGEINETHGSLQADALLQAVAERLRAAVRDSDTVGRVGGDSFAILPIGDTDVEAAATIAWKVSEAFELPFLSTGEAIQVSATDRDRALPPARAQPPVLHRPASPSGRPSPHGRTSPCSSPNREDHTAERSPSSMSCATASRGVN